MDYITVPAYLKLRKDGDTFFKCPFCWSEYNKKNGTPLKKATPKYHSIKEYIRANPDKVVVKDNKATVIIDAVDTSCDKDRFPFSTYCGFKVTV